MHGGATLGSEEARRTPAWARRCEEDVRRSHRAQAPLGVSSTQRDGDRTRDGGGGEERPRSLPRDARPLTTRYPAWCGRNPPRLSGRRADARHLPHRSGGPPPNPRRHRLRAAGPPLAGHPRLQRGLPGDPRATPRRAPRAACAAFDRCDLTPKHRISCDLLVTSSSRPPPRRRRTGARAGARGPCRHDRLEGIVGVVGRSRSWRRCHPQLRDTGDERATDTNQQSNERRHE